MSETVRFIHYRGAVIRITKNVSTGFWESDDGCIWAFRDDKFTLDPTDRPGIGFFSWRKWWPWYDELVDATRPHEYMYSSSAYQAFHTREEADRELERYVRAVANATGKKAIRILASPFRFLARLFGAGAWENKDTR